MQVVVGKQQQVSVSYHGEGIDDLSVYPADVCRGCNTADAALLDACTHSLQVECLPLPLLVLGKYEPYTQ